MTNQSNRDRIEIARDYLVAYFADEEGWQDKPPAELPDWFDALADYIDQLSLNDPRLVLASTYLAPFVNDDPNVNGGVMYYDGKAVWYLEDHWGSDFDEFFSGFVNALGLDYKSWTAGGFRL